MLRLVGSSGVNVCYDKVGGRPILWLRTGDEERVRTYAIYEFRWTLLDLAHTSEQCVLKLARNFTSNKTIVCILDKFPDLNSYPWNIAIDCSEWPSVVSRICYIICSDRIPCGRVLLCQQRCVAVRGLGLCCNVVVVSSFPRHWVIGSRNFETALWPHVRGSKFPRIRSVLAYLWHRGSD